MFFERNAMEDYLKSGQPCMEAYDAFITQTDSTWTYNKFARKFMYQIRWAKNKRPIGKFIVRTKSIHGPSKLYITVLGNENYSQSTMILSRQLFIMGYLKIYSRNEWNLFTRTDYVEYSAMKAVHDGVNDLIWKNLSGT